MAHRSTLGAVILGLSLSVGALSACDDDRSERLRDRAEQTGRTQQALFGAVTSACSTAPTFLPSADDASSNDVTGGPITLPFTPRSFGNKVVVSRNGMLSFDGKNLATKSPMPLKNGSLALIGPLWVDVGADTAPVATDAGSFEGGGGGFDAGAGGAASYCALTFVDEYGVGRNAFAATWRNVTTPGAVGANTFQVVLVDRSLEGQSGDFDIVFNYDSVQWDTAAGGVARAGYSGSDVTSRFELGNGQANAFIDSKSTGLAVTSTDSAIVGRHVFKIRAPITGAGGSGVVSGRVRDRVTQAGLAGAKVDVCASGGTLCASVLTNTSGDYSLGGLSPNTFTATATSADQHSPQTITGVVVTNSAATTVNFDLDGPHGPPPDTTISPSYGTIPMVFIGSPITLTRIGCSGGSGQYRITVMPDYQPAATPVVVTGPMQESAGIYTGTVGANVLPHGPAVVEISITCSGITTTIDFNIYIDPSGNVFDTNGSPIVGATVTLFSVDAITGVETVVPDGSVIMSPSNRRNPDLTNAAGYFGWDTTAGYYRVSAHKEGCVSADTADPGPAAFTSVVQVSLGHPVTGLVLTLNCPNASITGALDALLPTGDATTDAKISAAVAALTNIDATNPYAGDSSTVAKLMTIKAPPSLVTAIGSVIAQIVERDRAAAEAAIEAAVRFGGHAPKIEQARRAYAAGQELASKARLAAATDNYVDAWSKARDALKKL